MEIELDIYMNTDSTQELESLGIKVNGFDSFELEVHTFYQIDAIGPYENEGSNYAYLFSSGEKFITPLTYDELKEKIKIAKRNS